MKKIHKKNIIMFLLSISIVSAFIASFIFFINPNSKYSIYLKDGEVCTSKPTTETFSSTYNPKINFADTKISTLNNITLNFFNKDSLKIPNVLFKSQRYYFPLKTICYRLGYKQTSSNDIYTLSDNNNTIYLSENNFTKNDTTVQLRGDILKYNDEAYISVSDIENIFNLFATFNSKQNQITLLDNSQNDLKENISHAQTSDKIAFFRFEDFTCGDTNLKPENQIKIKCMVSFLHKNGIKFHTGWIPRFKAPENNIDNDLLTNENMINAGFINILDYMINNGGQIGLHGYTHQSGDQRSAVGEDLDENTNNNEQDARYVIESSIDTASALNIPITFFESPHYRSSQLQKSIVNEYFKYVYEPYDNSKSNIYSPNNKNIYIPTPLGYVPDPNDISSIEDGLKANNPKKLNSFFYHPSVELDFINYDDTSDKFEMNIDDKSPLKRIVNLLNDNKYVTIHITDIK